MITNASAADAIRKLTAWMRKYSRSPPKMKIRVKTAMTVTAMTNFPVSRANQFPASAIRVLLSYAPSTRRSGATPYTPRKTPETPM